MCRLHTPGNKLCILNLIDNSFPADSNNFIPTNPIYCYNMLTDGIEMSLESGDLFNLAKVS